MELKGNHTVTKGGKRGPLIVTVRLKPSHLLWRDGNHVFSSHSVKLHEVLRVSHSIKLKTVTGIWDLDINANQEKYELCGKGIEGGSHFALVQVQMPRGLDAEALRILDRLLLAEPCCGQELGARIAYKTEF